jgi:DNA-binding response OmpR family regulator
MEAFTATREIGMVTSALSGKSILLVDDDPDMITALQTILDGSGATIETAVDGNQAVEVAATFNPDLIVLDAMLPKRSGFLVLEKLKGANKKKGQRPFVIMITGNTGKRHQVWAESLGVDGYLNKPFRMERLMERIEQLLGSN